MTDILGLDPKTRVLTKLFDNAKGRGNVRLPDVARSYGDDCDVILVAVPKGEGLIFETRLWHELSGGESE